ncbi:hypothetical protein GCM10018953_04940 [Streptosporangium nondiastaticum]
MTRLRTAGFEPNVARIPWPDYADTPHGLMGVRVRIGSYPAKPRQAPPSPAELEKAAFRITEGGLPLAPAHVVNGAAGLRATRFRADVHAFPLRPEQAEDLHRPFPGAAEPVR